MNPESPFLRPLAEDEIETVQTIEKAARTRYRALGGVLARAAEGPTIASERFAGGETILAEHHGEPAGFVLLQPLDGLFYVTNVAVIPDAAGLGIGRLLMIDAEHRAQQLKVAGLSLTTFRTPPWNGPWSVAKAIRQFQRSALVLAFGQFWIVMQHFTTWRRERLSGSRATPERHGLKMGRRSTRRSILRVCDNGYADCFRRSSG